MKKENKIPRKLKKGLSWSAKYAILFDRIFMGGGENSNTKRKKKHPSLEEFEFGV